LAYQTVGAPRLEIASSPVTIVIISINAWAASIRSNGSRCSPSNDPARIA